MPGMIKLQAIPVVREDAAADRDNRWTAWIGRMAKGEPRRSVRPLR